MTGESPRVVFSPPDRVTGGARQPSGWRSVREALSGSLPGNTQGDGNLVPRPTLVPGGFDGFPEPAFVRAHGLSGRCDPPEILGVLNLDRRWVELIGQLLEPVGGPFDLVIRVSQSAHLLIQETGETSVAAAWRG